MPEELDQQFVEYVVKSIVDYPDSVTTERSVDDMGVLIALHVDARDMGTIIGKEGRTAKALRTLLRVLGAKYDARVNLKIIEPEGGLRMAEEVQQQPMSHYGNEAVIQALRDIPQDEIA